MFTSEQVTKSIPTLAAGFVLACLISTCLVATAAIPVGVDHAYKKGPFTESAGRVGVNWGGSAVPVGPNPLADPWTKTFVLSSPSLSEPDITRVTEKLRFIFSASRPVVPVIEWHEEILTPGFVWLDGEMKQLTLGANTIQTIAAGTVDGSSIRFDFPETPIESDDYLYSVSKRFAWVGSGDRPASVNVREYPAVVPEPSAIVLLGIGAVGLLSYALRRRRK